MVKKGNIAFRKMILLSTTLPNITNYQFYNSFINCQIFTMIGQNDQFIAVDFQNKWTFIFLLTDTI
jgi:hypothetical protein